jgi:hypothetical protein
LRPSYVEDGPVPSEDGGDEVSVASEPPRCFRADRDRLEWPVECPDRVRGCQLGGQVVVADGDEDLRSVASVIGQ